MAVCLTLVFGCGTTGKEAACSVLLLQMTPGLCGDVDGLVMVVIFSHSLGVCVGGLVKGDYISVLIRCMCCLLHLHSLPCALM